MKIGTDGVLLGAWTSVEKNPFSVLDIGAGTGVLSLMLAQRSFAELIDAIEIDADAYEQCTDNFENSPWNDRLFCYHASLEEFTEEIDDKYDLIISNPPFYSEDYKTEDSSRDLARFADALPFEELLSCASKLLSPEGTFSVIIPFKEEPSFLSKALEYGLYPSRILHVKGNPDSSFKRSLIEFSRYQATTEISELTIEISRHNYTEVYKELTKDFYLKM
ncbi:methyltransferase [Winogradskyella sp. 3972H.M.0a.05]|uniref:tRNA1(Val) (adenine(37)-N6)-methyltransferase n=1 Tax=Winogradskyella sp. 3972H.M.0a.05 TaxID=2950277 RepID=UPI0033982F6B